MSQDVSNEVSTEQPSNDISASYLARNEYADKLIDYLQSRNRALTLFLSLFVIASVAIGFFAFQLMATSESKSLRISELELALNDAQAATKNQASQFEQVASEASNEAAKHVALIQTLQQELEQLTDASSALESENVRLQQAYTELEDQKNINEAQSSRQSGKIAAQTTQIKDFKKDLNARKAAYAALAKRQQESLEDIESLRERLDKSEQRLGDSKKQFEKVRAELEQTRKLKSQYEQQVSEMESENRSLAESVATLSASIEAQKQKLVEEQSAETLLTAPIPNNRPQQLNNSGQKSALNFGEIAVD